ncbi:MAG: hypothetical protein R3F34_13795 [Planctomycetota bacterium]
MLAHRDQDVRWPEVAVDHALVVRVLDSVARPRPEQLEALAQSEPLLVAELRDRRAWTTPSEVRASRVRRAAVEHLRDTRMVHERQRLPLRLEALNHLARVHRA